MQIPKIKMVHANTKNENGTCKYPKTKNQHCAVNITVTESVLQSNGLVQHTGLAQRLWVQIPVWNTYFTAIQSFNKIIWWLILMHIKLSLAATKLSLLVHHYKPEYLVCLQPRIKDQQFEDTAETILFSLTILFWLYEPLTLKTDQFLDGPISRQINFFAWHFNS